MGLLSHRLGAGLRASSEWSPSDDRWFYDSPSAGKTLSGVNVSAESALKLSTWAACKRLLGNTAAMLPWDVFERMGDGGRRRAETNSTHILLHDSPNEYQTPFEFKQGLVSDLADYGNAINELRPGPRGVDQVWPIHPEYVYVDWYDRRSSRQRVYDVSSAHDGRPRVLRDDNVWHLRFASRNGGLTGASPIRLASEGIGLALATQVGMAKFFANGMVPALLYSVDQMLNAKQAGELRTRLKTEISGLLNWGEPLILGRGAKVEKPGISPKDALVKELLDYSVSDIARILGIPLVLLQAESKDTSWGTGIEHLKLAFATFTIGPLAAMLEESADSTLIVQRRRYFSEMNMNALLRGDLLRRYQAYAIAVNANNPWLVRNDIRRLENMNPDDGADGEKFLPPQNNVGARNVPGVAEASAIRAIDEMNASVRLLLKAQGLDVPDTKILNGHNGEVAA